MSNIFEKLVFFGSKKLKPEEVQTFQEERAGLLIKLGELNKTKNDQSSSESSQTWYAEWRKTNDRIASIESLLTRSGVKLENK